MKNSKPKQRFSLSTMALAAVLMVSGLSSCTKGENDDYLNLDGLGAISLSAGVQTTTNTRAAVVGETFPANTTNVFGLTAFSGAAAPDDWSVTPYFDNIYVSSDAASALTLATNQYYPANGDKVYFYGYAPVVGSLTAGAGSTATTASYTITGQEDIMAAQVVTGIAKVTTGTQPQPELKFTHKLMQLRFKVVADASFEANKKVTKVIVEKVKTIAKLSIGDGTLIFEDNAADKTLELPITSGTKDEITIDGTEMNGCLMFEPVGTDGMVMLQIEAGGVTYNDIEVTLTGEKNGEAGTSHLITLTFKRGAITPSASITDWEETGSGSADVGVPPPPPPVVGDYYYSDGSYSTDLIAGKTATGLIYYLDPVDPKKYKVMALEQSGLLRWAADYNYIVSDARSDTDGKANSAAIKAAFDANVAGITITQVNFAAAFPAAAYCYNYKGKASTDVEGSWHLPAKSELQYLWCSYNEKNPISWNTGTNTDATADRTAQGLWNNRITAGSSTGVIYSDRFWSNTESNSSSTPNVSSADFSNGSSDDSGKTTQAYVRCVRDI